MFNKIVPLQKDLHRNKKLKNIKGFSFAQNFHVASVMVHEFARASATYPIVFIEDKSLDRFRPIALLGLQADKNLFIDDEGKWQAGYIPAIIRRYPFVLAETSKDQFSVCIDEESEIITEEEGVALFNEDGSPAEVLENVKRYLGELHQMETVTTEFCKVMAENNLFVPLNMRVRQSSDKIQTIGGAYVINEERLNNLSDQRFLELHHKHYLPAIYAQLNSLAQIERLIRLSGAGETSYSEESVERISGEDSGDNLLH